MGPAADWRGSALDSVIDVPADSSCFPGFLEPPVGPAFLLQFRSIQLATCVLSEPWLVSLEKTDRSVRIGPVDPRPQDRACSAHAALARRRRTAAGHAGQGLVTRTTKAGKAFCREYDRPHPGGTRKAERRARARSGRVGNSLRTGRLKRFPKIAGLTQFVRTHSKRAAEEIGRLPWTSRGARSPIGPGARLD